MNTEKYQMSNIHHTSNQKDLVMYLHQCVFSPITLTLKVIHNDYLLGVTGILVESVNNHLPPSKATIKGQMYRNP